MRDYGVVGISSKVEQESESENPDTLVFGGELFVLEWEILRRTLHRLAELYM